MTTQLAKLSHRRALFNVSKKNGELTVALKHDVGSVVGKYPNPEELETCSTPCQRKLVIIIASVSE